MSRAAEIPAGRRKLERNEHLFLGRTKKCRPHVWINTSMSWSGPVVACSLCGKLKAGETMPAMWVAIVP